MRFKIKGIIKIDEISGIDSKDLVLIIIKGLIAAAGLGYVFYENIFAAIVFFPFFKIYLKKEAAKIKEFKKKQLCLEFREGMVAVSFSLNVGYSIENSFREAIEELILLYGEDGRIVKEFRYIVNRSSLGENIEDVIEDFAKKSEVEDIMYFAEVFRYAKRNGGDLIAIIRNTAESIRDRLETGMEIETVISGKKMEQQVMYCVPFGIILYLKLTAPEFVEPLYNNLFGILVMSFCLLLYGIAVWISAKIMKIEVS